MSSQATRDFLIGLAAFAVAGSSAVAQYPGQVTNADKNAPSLRSVAVLEWTGDEQHPKASRLIPVTVFDGQQLQDGGFYLARPEPLALEGEVEYQLKDNGKNTGLFVINNAAQEQGAWVGYGTWKALPKPKPAAAASTQSWKEDDADSDKPTLHRKGHADDGSDKSGAGTGPADPDRPTLHKGGDSGSSGGSGSGGSGSGGSSSGGSGSGDSSASGPAADPDRPVLHRTPDDSASGGDADRPKLNKKNGDNDEGHVTSLPDVSDPDRPRLIPGRPADMGPSVLPSLLGLPADMQQAVAVSDVKKAPEHIWSFSWANPDDEAKYEAQLEDMARAALGLNAPPAAAKPAPKKPVPAHSSTHKTQLKLPPAPAPLADEHFRVFELAYGSGATLVLSARTDGSGPGGNGPDTKYVTIVAQPGLYGDLTVLLKNVTDAAHLDDKPRMRLVDAVDAMADNRGELLFELRGQTQRQFALYRVLRGQALQVFVGGGRELAVANTASTN